MSLEITIKISRQNNRGGGISQGKISFPVAPQFKFIFLRIGLKIFIAEISGEQLANKSPNRV